MPYNPIEVLMDDLSPAVKICIVALIIYGTSLHEMAHAYTATWLGDPTPGKAGRLTTNPLPHLQPFVTAVLAPLFFYLTRDSLLSLAFTPVDPSRFKRPLRDQAIVAVAGPIMNFLLAGLLIGILWIPNVFVVYNDGTTNVGVQIAFNAALWNIIIGIFNLLPLPPLDGYRIARVVLPLQLRRQVDDIMRMGPVVFLIPMFIGSWIISELNVPIFILFTKMLPTLTTVQ